MTTRDAILDGALQVLRARGLARATTRDIARAAGYSEATLYKLFADKTDLLLAVLAERLPRISTLHGDPAALAGTGSVAGQLRQIAIEVTGFYLTVLPLSMSIFSDSALLARHRDALRSRGPGPEAVSAGVAAYLTAEQAAGRIGPGAPAEGAALALVGACMHRAFLWCFDGDAPGSASGADAPAPASAAPPGADALAVRAFAAEVVAAILPGLDVR